MNCKLHEGQVSENSMNSCLPDNVKHRCSGNQVHWHAPTKAWLTTSICLYRVVILTMKSNQVTTVDKVLMDEVH